MSAVQPAIAIHALQKAFGANQVLRGIDLEVATGESVAVIGGSGTGKSVLLKCVLGLVTPDAGSILIDGKETVPLRGRARARHLSRFGMLFQGGALFDSLSIWQNIAFAVPGPAAARRAHAIALLERVGLGPEIADLGPAELSGGMQKRVALARAVAAGADIIFFDEPTAGLDPIMAGHISRLIRELVRDFGITALTISHDMASVRVIAQRVAMLYQGEIIWQGSASQLDSPDNPIVDQFVHGRSDGPFALQVRRP